MSNALTDKQNYWSEHLEKAKQFDGSLAEYARSQQLSAQALYGWRNRFKQLSLPKDSATPKPRPVFTQVVSSTADKPSGLTLQLGNAQFRFTHLPDPQWLANLVAEVKLT